MNTKKRNTRILVVVAIAAVVLLALPKLRSSNGSSGNGASGGAGGAQRAGAPAGQGQQIQVRGYVVQVERLGDRVVTVGSIFANEEVEVRSEIAGKIQTIHFKEGARVQKGDPLVSINDEELQASWNRAAAREMLARQQEERQRTLFRKELASPQEYEAAQTNLQMMQAEAQLAKAQLNKTVIRAPFTGSVGLRYVSEGSYINPQTLITTLQDKNTVKIDIAAPEKYAMSIRKGDTLAFRVQGLDKRFTGTIYAIDPKIDPATRTLKVRAASPNRDGLIVPGSLATVEIAIREKESMMIPSFAIIPEMKGHKVFLFKGGKAESRPVEIGRRTDENVEVVAGLQPGDTVVTSGILQLRDGMAVQLTAQAGGDSRGPGSNAAAAGTEKSPQ